MLSYSSFMNVPDKNDKPCLDVDHIFDPYVLFSSPLASTLFAIEQESSMPTGNVGEPSKGVLGMPKSEISRRRMRFTYLCQKRL